MKKSAEVGVIGFGNFGKFFAQNLVKRFSVTAYDAIDYSNEAVNMGVGWGTFTQVAISEVVVVAVPLQTMEIV